MPTNRTRRSENGDLKLETGDLKLEDGARSPKMVTWIWKNDVQELENGGRKLLTRAGSPMEDLETGTPEASSPPSPGTHWGQYIRSGPEGARGVLEG